MLLLRRTIVTAVSLVSLALPASAGAQAIINTSRSNIKNIALQLDGTKDVTDVLSMEGGQLVPDITLINTAPFQRVKQLGKPKFEDITITVSADLGVSMAAWVADTLSGRQIKTRSGHMIALDDKDRIVQRVRFYNALITEVSLPALDGSSKDTSFLTIAISPTTAESAGAFPAGTHVDAKIGGKQKQWLCSNFRIRFDDPAGFEVAEGKKGLNAVNVKQARQGAASGGSGYELSPPQTLTEADLEFTSERWATDPYAEDVQRLMKGVDIKHFVSVDYLNDAGDVLFTLRRTLSVYKVTLETGEAGPDLFRVSMVGDADPIAIIWAKK